MKRNTINHKCLNVRYNGEWKTGKHDKAHVSMCLENKWKENWFVVFATSDTIPRYCTDVNKELKTLTHKQVKQVYQWS